MHTKATSLIEAAKLHPKLKEKLLEDFSLTESGAPSAKLDVKPEMDAEGNVVKSALTLLESAVEDEIKDALELQSSLGTRTRVRGQGGSAETGKKRITLAELQESASMTDEERAEADAKRRTSTTGSPLTDALLTEAGVPADNLGTLWSRS